MEEGIDTKGMSEPDPVAGCGLILFMICTFAVMIISILGYILFKVDVMLLILLLGVLAIVSGIILCIMLKSRKHE